MEHYWYFLNRNKKKGIETGGSQFVKRSKDGKVHVAILSDFFGSMSENLFCTNGMYSDFLETVNASVSVCSAKEQIVLDVYENESSTEEMREVMQIGFRRYINACHRKLRSEYVNQLLQVSFFALVGVFLIVLMRGVKPNIPEWTSVVIEQTGTVLIWQFVGYFAFEHTGQKRELQRLKQIGAMEYSFRKWE